VLAEVTRSRLKKQTKLSHQTDSFEITHSLRVEQKTPTVDTARMLKFWQKRMV